jgi:hypothetical protein
MALDFSTPGAIFLLLLLLGPFNFSVGKIHRPLDLVRSEPLVVYAILITASAIPIIGLSEYLLTITTGAQHYATPENEWAIPTWMVPQSPSAITWFSDASLCEVSGFRTLVYQVSRDDSPTPEFAATGKA